MNSRKTRSAGSDELAIRNLVAKIAHAADHGEIDEYSSSSPRTPLGDAGPDGDGPRSGRAENGVGRSPGPEVPRVMSLTLGASATSDHHRLTCRSVNRILS